MSNEIKDLYEFGPFRLDATRRLVTREKQVLPLTSKVFDTLLVLVRNRDRVLVKDELMKMLWPDSFVEEVNLAQNVLALRKLLGETPGPESLYRDHTGRRLSVCRRSTQYSDGKYWEDKPRWSPDGRTIYFVSNRTGFYNV